MALGAEPGGVVRSVFVRALLVASAGVLVGCAAVFALGGLIESLLYETGTADPLATGVVAIVLNSVAGVAAWLPARRAAWIAPSEALRSE